MNDDPNGTAMHDQHYYRENPGKDEPADYKITAYDLDIKIGRVLEAKAEMSFDTKKDSYNMTLYHGYKITAAYDQSGAELKFRRDGDYVTIDCNDATEKIVVAYEGYSPRYYSNEQGVFLPAYFAYYPRAGFIALADDNHSDIRQVLCEYKSKFNIRASYGQVIFSNIDEIRENTFQGETDGVTLYSGFLKEAKNGSLRVVYPYLCDENTDDNVGALCDRLRSDGVGDSTVFITPSVNESLGGAKLDDQILFHGVAYSLKQLEDDGAGDVK
jgi:hypothetical protein